ncbi:hypothetical protein [Nocardia africana]
MTSGSQPTGDPATTTDTAARPKQRPARTRQERWAAAMAAIVLPGMVVPPLPAAAFAPVR